MVYAVDFLTESTRAVLDGGEPVISAKYKDVIVVGGGDTGNDCVATALRQGARSVVQLEIMPAPPAVRAPGNAWPHWPNTLRTDYGQLEAIAVQGADPRVYETAVQRVISDAQHQITAVEAAHMVRSADGSLLPEDGTQQILPCQLLLVAAGFVGSDPSTVDAFSLNLNRRGVPDIRPNTHMISPGLFAAGDMRTGQSLVVRAIADGIQAADEVHDYLMR